jgi:hypothetical protein
MTLKEGPQFPLRPFLLAVVSEAAALMGAH